MADELEIVLNAQIRADEEASANNITAQLPSIEQRVNARGGINVRINVDTGSVNPESVQRAVDQAFRGKVNLGVGIDQAQFQRNLDSVVQAARNTLNSGISFDTSITTGGINNLSNFLSNIGLSNDMIQQSVKGLNDMNVNVNRITHSWSEAGEAEERILSLIISGTDQAQNQVQVMQRFYYDEENHAMAMSQNLTKVTSDYERLQRQAQQITETERRQDDMRQAALNRQYNTLENIYALADGTSSVKPITDPKHGSDIAEAYGRVYEAIQQARAATGEYTREEKSQIDNMLSDLRRLVQGYQNAEYAATSLRTKTVDQIKVEQTGNIDKFVNKIKNAGIYTEQFESQVAGLRNVLKGVTDRAGITDFLNQFDQIKTQASTMEERLKSVNNLYKQLEQINKRITDLKININQMDPASQRYELEAQQKILNILTQQRNSISLQIASYKDILNLSTERNENERKTQINAQRVNTANAQMRQRLAEVNSQMQVLDAKAIQIKYSFDTLSEPTDHLASNLKEIDRLQAAFNSATDTNRKLGIYNELKRVIGECSAELSALKSAETLSFGEDKLSVGIEKARASLRGLEQEFAFIHGNGDLSIEFDKLLASLDRVSTGTEFKQWNLDMQEFCDIVATTQQRIADLDSIYSKLISKDREITSLEITQTGLDPTKDKDRIAANELILETLRSQRQELLNQAATYNNVVEYSKMHAAYVSQAAINEEKLEAANAKLDDTARRMAESMSAVKARVDATVASFFQLQNPSADLESRVKQLSTLMEAFNQASSSREKISIFKQLSALMRDVRTEISSLNQVNSKMMIDDRSLSNLEKARGQLENLRAQYSFLTSMPDLNAKFELLAESLAAVSTRGEFQTWAASFGSLRTELIGVQKEINTVNSLYSQLIAKERQISNINVKVSGLSPTKDSEQIAALEQEKALLQEQTAEIRTQVQEHNNLITALKLDAEYINQGAINTEREKVAAAELRDVIAHIDSEMKLIPGEVNNIIARFNQLKNPSQNLTENVAKLRELMNDVANASGDKNKQAAYEKLAATISQCNKELGIFKTSENLSANTAKLSASIQKAQADLTSLEREWSALKTNPGLNTQLKILQANLQNVETQTDFSVWTKQMSAFKAEVKAAGLNCKTLFDAFKENVGKVMQWFSATTLLFRGFRMLREAITTVIDLDTAMIDLKKTTKESEETYQAFYEQASLTAKALGVTTEEIISQTAEFTRLGYQMKDAEKLSQYSSIFSSVSPGMGIETATEGIVSVMKAYGYQAEDVLDGIISKINKIGNTAAVSNLDLVEALTRSSASMAAANNSLEETIGLATAAVEITRDAGSVGEFFVYPAS